MLRYIIQYFLLFLMGSFYCQSDIMVKEELACYYNSKTTEPLYVYGAYEGEVIDSIFNSLKKWKWINVELTESKNGWFKIVFIKDILDDNNFVSGKNDFWINTDKLILDLRVYTEDYFVVVYEDHNLKSKVIFKFVKFQTVNVVAFTENWVEIWTLVDGEVIKGWVSKSDVCAYPWTACP